MKEDDTNMRLDLVWRCLGVVLGVFATVRTAIPADEVPAWFASEPDKPFKVYEAWRHLSTRAAAVYLWNPSRTGVIAGLLQDEDGKALPLTHLQIGFFDGLRGYGANLQTDAAGFFIVYGPYSKEVRVPVPNQSALERLNSRACEFDAAPGYPCGEEGYWFARSKNAVRECTARLVLKADSHSFFVLTCSKVAPFDQEEFATWKKTRTPEVPPRPRWRAKPQEHKGKTADCEKVKFRVQVLNPAGRPVEKALLHFRSSAPDDGGGSMIVKTDEKGRATLLEYLPNLRDRRYEQNIRRDLMVDAGAYGVGPVKCDLKADQLNTIALKQPGMFRGSLSDSQGRPVTGRMRIVYEGDAYALAFETDFIAGGDGRFSFDAVMPGEPFRIVSESSGHQSTPQASATTAVMTLAPGEEKKDIVLTRPLPAAIGGIFQKQNGEQQVCEVTCYDEDGRGWGTAMGEDGTFFFNALGDRRYRFELRRGPAELEGFLSDWVQPEPGELRWVVLKPRTEEERHRHIQTLIEELGHEKDRVRAHSIDALHRYGPEAQAALPALIKALADPSRHVRRAAAGVIAGLGPVAVDAVPALCVALQDGDPYTRIGVLHALIALGPQAKATVADLVKSLEDLDSTIRDLSACALGNLGEAAETAVPALADALADRELGVRQRAAEALGKLGAVAHSAIPKLEQAVEVLRPHVKNNLCDDKFRAWNAMRDAIEKIRASERQHSRSDF